MRCPVCKLKADELYAGVVNGKYMSDRCDICYGLNKQQTPTSMTRGDYRKDRQREDHRKSMIQPYKGADPNPEFAVAYPERAKEYYNDDQMRQMRL